MRKNKSKIMSYIQWILLIVAISTVLYSGDCTAYTYQYWAIFLCLAISRLI